MLKEKRYVKKITEEEEKELRKIMEKNKSSRVRKRAHSILLSNEGYTRKEIGKIYKVDVDTVSRWLNNWEAKGIEGLADQPKSGRPRILDPEEEKMVLEAIEEDPRSVKNVQAKVAAETNKQVSQWTIKRILKRGKKNGNE